MQVQVLAAHRGWCSTTTTVANSPQIPVNSPQIPSLLTSPPREFTSPPRECTSPPRGFTSAAQFTHRGWCSTTTTVVPSAATSLSTAMMSRLVEESKPEVGSSKNRTVGSATSSRPMLRRLRCPPEMPRVTCGGGTSHVRGERIYPQGGPVTLRGERICVQGGPVT
eukprot:1195011-Prorocentrum_minimum.AAC.2